LFCSIWGSVCDKELKYSVFPLVVLRNKEYARDIHIFAGAFRVEMQRESQKDRTILCKFDPTEPGDYRVEVKWAGELVPGSPFIVMIFDTQEELNRFLQVIE